MGVQKQRDRCTCDFSSLVCRSLFVQGVKEWIFWKFYDYLQSYWEQDAYFVGKYVGELRTRF